MEILSGFCDIDDFCSRFEPVWRPHRVATAGKKRPRASSLALREVLAILVLFHGLHYRTFKHFYLHHVCTHLRPDFPGLPSYSRFVALIPSTLLPLCGCLQTRQGQPTGIPFIDSLPIRVCHNRRIHSHRVFDGFAQRGRSSVDWFYGFKWHLVINDKGELLGLCLTSGHVDDRRPVAKLVRQLWGKRFGDRGYLSQRLFDRVVGPRTTADHEAKEKDEEQADADGRQALAPPAVPDRVCQRSAEEHQSDGTHTAPQRG